MSKFLFDLDETLVSGDLIFKASKILYMDKTYSNKDVESWNLGGIPKDLKSFIVDKIYPDPNFAVWSKKPINGVINFLNYLKLLGHDVDILTGRRASCWYDTTKFIDKHFPMVDKLFMVDYTEAGKSAQLKEIDPDYYFDDAPHYCDESRELGIETFLVSNNYTPWNHQYDIDVDHILENVSWLDVDITR